MAGHATDFARINTKAAREYNKFTSVCRAGERSQDALGVYSLMCIFTRAMILSEHA